MIVGNQFDELRALDVDVLREIVRDGEVRVQAQLQIANAADQRALTFGGFQIAAATASLAGGVALMSARNSDFLLAFLAIVFALTILIAAGIAIWTVMPRKFAIPGNEPSSWFPANWRWPEKGLELKAALVEQASCLQEMIEKNQRHCSWAARLMHWSMYVTVGAVGAASLILLGILLSRHLG